MTDRSSHGIPLPYATAAVGLILSYVFPAHVDAIFASVAGFFFGVVLLYCAGWAETRDPASFALERALNSAAIRQSLSGREPFRVSGDRNWVSLGDERAERPGSVSKSMRDETFPCPHCHVQLRVVNGGSFTGGLGKKATPEPLNVPVGRRFRDDSSEG
jgi:hypothetical protein